MMRINILLSTIFFVASSLAGTVVENIGELKHGTGAQEVIVTFGASFDQGSHSLCLHVGMTRNGGGAATAMDCYRASSSGRFELTKLDSLTHDSSNVISLFKVEDRANSIVCFGNAMTRSGNIIYDQQGGKLAGAGAALSLQCGKIN